MAPKTTACKSRGRQVEAILGVKSRNPTTGEPRKYIVQWKNTEEHTRETADGFAEFPDVLRRFIADRKLSPERENSEQPSRAITVVKSVRTDRQNAKPKEGVVKKHKTTKKPSRSCVADSSSEDESSDWDVPSSSTRNTSSAKSSAGTSVRGKSVVRSSVASRSPQRERPPTRARTAAPMSAPPAKSGTGTTVRGKSVVRSSVASESPECGRPPTRAKSAAPQKQQTRFPPIIWADSLLKDVMEEIKRLPPISLTDCPKDPGFKTEDILVLKGVERSTLRTVDNRPQSKCEVVFTGFGPKHSTRLFLPEELVPSDVVKKFRSTGGK